MSFLPRNPLTTLLILEVCAIALFIWGVKSERIPYYYYRTLILIGAVVAAGGLTVLVEPAFQTLGCLPEDVRPISAISGEFNIEGQPLFRIGYFEAAKRVGAKCHGETMTDHKGQKVLFFREICYFGGIEPDEDWFTSRDESHKKRNSLLKTNTVIVIQCNVPKYAAP